MSSTTINDDREVIGIDGLNFIRLLDGDKIRNKIQELASTIEKNLPIEQTTFLVVMNGAFMFGAYLISHFAFPVKTNFIYLPSYTGMRKKTGGTTIPEDIELPDKNEHILIIDDILDSGETLTKLTGFFKEKVYKNNKIKVCVLLVKDKKREYDVVPDFYGFVIPDVFVVGFGLDYNGKGRNLSSIYMHNKKE